MYYHFLITNIFRSVLRSSGSLYKRTDNTTDCQIIKMKPLNVITNASNFPYDHKMSAYVLRKSDKM